MANRFDIQPVAKTSFFAPSSEGVRARDVIRELPTGFKETAKSIGQSIARSFGATGAAITGKPQFKPEGKIQEAIFGTKEPFSFRTIGEETLTGFGVQEQTAKKLGLPVGVVLGGLDVVPALPSKKGAIEATELIAKTADTALSRLIMAIKFAKPARKELEVLASAERSRRIGAAAGILEKVEGEKAFIQAKGQLKGKLVPQKPKFEPLRVEPQKAISRDLEFLAQEARKFKTAEEFVRAQETFQTLRGTKGMTADDIMKTHPDIKLTKDVPATDIYGNKVKIPEGEALTPYELKGNKILLQDGETYIVSKNQFENIKGQSVSKEAKPFAPELAGTEESILGNKEKLDTIANKSFGKSWDEIVPSQRGQLLREGKITKAEMDMEVIKSTKYSQYQLPGGKNYKEILIKTPSKNIPPEKLSGRQMELLYDETAVETFGKPWNELPDADRASVQGIINKHQKKEFDFRGSHWDEPNVISHLRMNERTYQGKKVAFMEELQSDWARAGREKGFATPLTEIEKPEFDKLLSRWQDEATRKRMTTNELTRFEELRQKNQTVTAGGVSPHPLLKNWQEPTVKRALQEAVNTNADYFAWISGEQTSARYNLATQVESVEWFKPRETGKRAIKIIPKGEKGVINMDINKNGEIVASHNVGWKGKKLDEVLGKGLADKIMEKESGTLSGEGLKFGGEWANNLYDKQVADIVHNVTGAKVEKLDMGLPIGDKGDSFWVDGRGVEGVQITPSMLKVGKEIKKGMGEKYIITDILGEGKFKAVTKTFYDRAKKSSEVFVEKKDQLEALNRNLNQHKEPFDISVKKSPYQLGIKLTPEIKAKIRGESLKFGASGKQFEDTKSQLTDFYNQAVKGIEETTKGITQFDADTLFIQIQRSPDLTVFEKISAADGFGQLLQGEIPQASKLSLLEDVFGKELITEVLKKRGNLDKFKDLVTEVLNIPRSLMASFDMSAPLRQGVIFTTTKPKIAARAGYEMFRQVFSEKNYIQWIDDLKKDPFYKTMKEADLYISDPRRVSGGLAEREERFMSNLAEKIPLIGSGVRAAERAYTSYLNKLRVDVFASISGKFEKMGLSQKENVDLYKALAGFVNNATGRGDLGKFNRVSQQLNTLFFSPRLIASRFNMLNPVYYARLPAPVRKEAIKSFAEFIGIGTTILTLAKLGGAEVEGDPRSTDFGKIRVGNTRWDIWGGFQQWVRVFSQIASGARKTQKGEIIELSRKKFPFETRLDVTERFLRGKLAPIPSLALELFEGSKLFGEEIKPTQEFVENVTPLYLQDISEAFDQLGSSAMFTVGVPAFFGVGTQTYEEKRKENRFNF